MAGTHKEYELSLLQREPDREKLLGRMRGKLANFTPPPEPAGPSFAVRRRMRKQAWTWVVRIALVAMIAAVNWLLMDRKDQILSKMGYEGVPGLPEPAGNLSADEQALYYAYALYDFAKFKARFGAAGYPAVDQAATRRLLEDLMPQVSNAVLGEISGYAPVGFRQARAGGRP